MQSVQLCDNLQFFILLYFSGLVNWWRLLKLFIAESVINCVCDFFHAISRNFPKKRFLSLKLFIFKEKNQWHWLFFAEKNMCENDLSTNIFPWTKYGFCCVAMPNKDKKNCFRLLNISNRLIWSCKFRGFFFVISFKDS